MVLKQSMQSLQKVKLSSALCNHCKSQKVTMQVAKKACYTLQPNCNLSRNATGTQVEKKIAPSSSSFIDRFYFVQRLQRFFETISSCSPSFYCVFRHYCKLQPGFLLCILTPLQVAARVFIVYFDTIASCSPSFYCVFQHHCKVAARH